MFAGHGLLPGGAPPAGDPRPAASLLHHTGSPAAASAQELRHEERRPGQVRMTYKHRQKRDVVSVEVNFAWFGGGFLCLCAH